MEEKVTEIEVRAILDRILDLGDGDIVDGTIKAVESGVLDSPWSPNVNVKDKVLGVRDARGACRYLEFGNCPIPERDQRVPPPENSGEGEAGREKGGLPYRRPGPVEP